MDFKDFKDGLISLALVIYLFSLTYIVGSYVLQPYIGLKTADRDFIVIICLINLFFSAYYFIEAFRLEKIFKLEDQHIMKFGQRIGIVTLFYIPHFFFVILILFMDIHNLQKLMAGLIFLVELCLMGLVFKEVYDILFLEESERKFELEQNRIRYIEREKKPLPGDNE